MLSNLCVSENDPHLNYNTMQEISKILDGVDNSNLPDDHGLNILDY